MLLWVLPFTWIFSKSSTYTENNLYPQPRKCSTPPYLTSQPSKARCWTKASHKRYKSWRTRALLGTERQERTSVSWKRFKTVQNASLLRRGLYADTFRHSVNKTTKVRPGKHTLRTSETCQNSQCCTTPNRTAWRASRRHHRKGSWNVRPGSSRKDDTLSKGLYI